MSDAWDPTQPRPREMAPVVAPPEGPPAAPGGRRRVHPLAATDLTFGPVGRVVATVVMLAPYWLFTHSILGIAGLVLWTPVFFRGMRDVWRRSDRVIDRRTASERGLDVKRPDDVPIVRTEYPGDGDQSEPPRRW